MAVLPSRNAVLSYITTNIGDDMQSLAARRFFDGMPVAGLQREHLNSFEYYFAKYKLIMNGWFTHKPKRWPPAPTINPLVISFHLSPHVIRRKRKFLSGATLEWFRRQSLRNGVGTRDFYTLRAFQEAGIDAYFSGCLTMTMKPNLGLKKSDELLMIDVDERAAHAISERTRSPFRKETQLIRPGMTQASRLHHVRRRFDELCSAKAVVTSRIHVAFPCLAIGTPVLMVHPHPDNERFGGIVEHLHFATPEDVIAGRYSFNFDDPPQNKQTHLPLVAEMERRCAAFVNDRA